MAAPGSAVSRLRLLALGLAPAVCAASTVQVLTHPTELPLVALVLLILLVPIGVFQPVPKLVLRIGASATAFQVGLAIVGLEPGGWPAVLAAPGFLVVGALAEAFGRECALVEVQRARVARVVEDLTPTDSVAGVTKWSHAQPTFTRELARARRYKQPLALLMVAPERWERVSQRVGHDKAKAAVAEIGAHLVTACRNVDIVAYRDGGTFGLLLPDTDLVGAEVVAGRIAELVCASAPVRLRVGLAGATSDMESVDALIRDAETACTIAERLGRPWMIARAGDEIEETEYVAGAGGAPTAELLVAGPATAARRVAVPVTTSSTEVSVVA